MKFSTILRMAALVVLGAVMLGWAAALSAADPAGDSPANGIPVGVGSSETCASQTLAPGAQVWLKVPYHAGTDLEMHVKSVAGVNFDVYDPSQVANWPTLPQPIGRLQQDPNEPGYADTWKGKLALGDQSGFYYVLVTNTNQFQVTFSFCTIQAEQFSFGLPPPGGPPAATSSSQSSDSKSSDSAASSDSSSTPD